MPQHSETCGRGRRQEWRHDKQIISNNYYYSTYSWFFKHLETTMTYHGGFSPLCRSRPLSDAGMGRHHHFPLFGAEDKSVIRCSLQWLATLAYYNLSTVSVNSRRLCRARKVITMHDDVDLFLSYSFSRSRTERLSESLRCREVTNECGSSWLKKPWDWWELSFCVPSGARDHPQRKATRVGTADNRRIPARIGSPRVIQVGFCYHQSYQMLVFSRYSNKAKDSLRFFSEFTHQEDSYWWGIWNMVMKE